MRKLYVILSPMVLIMLGAWYFMAEESTLPHPDSIAMSIFDGCDISVPEVRDERKRLFENRVRELHALHDGKYSLDKLDDQLRSADCGEEFLLFNYKKNPTSFGGDLYLRFHKETGELLQEQ